MPLTSDKAKELGKRSSRKGVPNKSTKEIREIFQYVIENNLDQIQDDLDQLEPIARLRVIIELSKFILPTLKATDVSLTDKEKITISFLD